MISHVCDMLSVAIVGSSVNIHWFRKSLKMMVQAVKKQAEPTTSNKMSVVAEVAM